LGLLISYLRVLRLSACGLKQRFKKQNEHCKTVKNFRLDKAALVKVLVVSSKYLNPHYVKSFPLAAKRIAKYQRASNRVIGD